MRDRKRKSREKEKKGRKRIDNKWRRVDEIRIKEEKKAKKERRQ